MEEPDVQQIVSEFLANGFVFGFEEIGPEDWRAVAGPRKAGGLTFVVGSGRTKLEAAQHAKERYEQVSGANGGRT